MCWPAAAFAPSSSTTYKILTTTNVNGLGGTTFSSVTTNLAFLTPSLSYTANDVTLTLATAAGGTGDPGGGDPGGGATGGGTGGGRQHGFGFAKVAQTRNQRAVATALDRGPVSNPLIIAVLNQTVAGARQAFDALSGEVFGSVHNTQGQEAQFARSAMLGRMRQSSYAGIPGDLGALGFGGPALAYAADNASAAYATKAAPGARGPSRDLTFWAQGLGGWGHADSDGNAASLRSRFGGFLSGVDARFGETWRAGFVAGYMRSDLNVDARSSSAGIDSVQLGGYASGRVGAFNVRGGGSYSLDSIDTSRAIVFPGFTDKASARFHGNVGQVFGEVGYGMAFGSVAVEPLAGLAYVHVRDGSFLESGGVAALSGSSANENTGYSFLGVRAATAMPLANGTVLVPRGMLQWQHAFGDVTPTTALAFQGTGAGVLGCRHPDRARHGAGRSRLRLALCPAGQARCVLSGRTRRARADPCGQRRLHLGFLIAGPRRSAARRIQTHCLSPVMPATNLSAVMPGFMPGIHVLATLQHQRRGWPGQARP